VKTKDIVRAWKDVGYRQNLSEADRAKLPAHPAGMIELTDADLGVVSGGKWIQLETWEPTCTLLRTVILC
jgi:mersacidin/lichenicidin family type 2 lantibiotic